MDKKPVNIFLKIVKILLPLAAIVMGSIQGSYMKTTITAESQVVDVPTNFFVMNGTGLLDFAPLACMLLCIAATAMAVYCAFKETEDNLVRLGHLLCIGMVADLLIAIFMTATIWCWCIAAVLGIALAITVVQEIRMENKRKKNV